MTSLPESLAEELAGARRLPDSFVERARAVISGEVEPVVARDAATVALLRDTAAGIEVYTLRRQQKMAFAPGMYVFPGGSVDERDAHRSVAWVGPPAEFWAAAFAVPEDLARALVCAAVRETFEEAGVLLAGPDAHSVVADTSGAEWEADRRALIDQELSFAEFLDKRALCLRADLLTPWAHWITPRAEPRRFDTRFFVAAMPAGQRTREFGEEADQVEWIRPADAIERWRARDLAMMPPTLITIAELAEFPDAAAALAEVRDIQTVEPVVVINDGHADVVLPEGYLS
ncbi:MAG: NUDIX hydrolase [Sporichthyaceae bacterium]